MININDSTVAVETSATFVNFTSAIVRQERKK